MKLEMKMRMVDGQWQTTVARYMDEGDTVEVRDDNGPIMYINLLPDDDGKKVDLLETLKRYGRGLQLALGGRI